MLAELRRAMPDAACTAAVCPERELGVAPLGCLALGELRVLGRLARRDAQVDRHVIFVAQAQPFGGGLCLEYALQLARQRITVRPALRVAAKSIVAQRRHDAHEVLPEMLFQDTEREPLAIG